MRVVLDSDVLAYSCGFAAQRTTYDCAIADAAGNLASECVVESQRELKDLEAMVAGEGGTVYHAPLVEAEPLEHALYMVKRTLLKLEEDLDRQGIEFDKLELFLTGKGNFREGLATIRGYKANRTAAKPVHYRAIRRYLRERYDATLVRGWEADDEVAMAAHAAGYDPGSVCIVSADKDLATVPGRLWNLQKKTMRIITPQEALGTFYRQVLTGDPTDNILGCFKVGPKAAEGLVTDDMPEKDMAATVLGAFEASVRRPDCPYRELGAYGAFLETARLVHMCRTPAETIPGGYWEPPK